MPIDLYSDAEEGAPAPAASESKTGDSYEEKEPSENEATAELPKAVLGGKEFKPGEEVVLEIVRVGEDSVVVKYASEKGEGYHSEEAENESKKGSNPGGGMESMMY